MNCLHCICDTSTAIRKTYERTSSQETTMSWDGMEHPSQFSVLSTSTQIPYIATYVLHIPYISMHIHEFQV